jgi:hypothetical protein
LWSKNVFEPFQKRIDNEINEFKTEVRETLARHEAKLNEINDILERNRLDGILERNNLK